MRKSRKTKGGECRIGIGFPRFGGKRKTVKNGGKNELYKTLLSIPLDLSITSAGGGCGCGSSKPSMTLPSNVSQAPLTLGLLKGAGCPCASIPKLPTALGGGYRATKRNLKYLKLWKQGKSIGFTMRSSLKAKGLIPRANGKKRVSEKYKK